ncbi:hypothetical protein ONZ45_g11996 [Pleurotus djamor]|nr:hypothetical protein ONZ45_g11996 [Pleurotus djamor]
MSSSLPLPLKFYHIFAQTGVPVLLGAIINCPLFGITVAQTIWYYRTYPRDSMFMKGWLDLYFACITVTMVQGTFAYRVFVLSEKNWWITSVLATLTLCQFAAGIGMSIVQSIHNDISALHIPISTILGHFEFSSTILCDLLISLSLAYYLNRCRSGIRRTENLVDTLIIYVVGIGLLTTVFAILVFVTWIVMPERLIFFTFHSIISKLYVNSLLVTLNARTSLGSLEDDEVVSDSINLSGLGSGSTGSSALDNHNI